MDLSLLQKLIHAVLWLIISISIGVVIGFKWHEKRVIKEQNEEESEDESDMNESSSDEMDDDPDFSMKMVLCVRKDLPMTKGKTCAQCCHAAVGAVSHARRHTKDLYNMWKRSGCKKVALSCPDEETFWNICKESDKCGLTHYSVCDAGRTQLEPHTYTVVAIGPDKEERIDKITGRDGSYSLKLL